MPRPRKGPRFGGSSSHDRKIMSNLAIELFLHEKVTTTLPRAQAVRPLAEKLIRVAAGPIGPIRAWILLRPVLNDPRNLLRLRLLVNMNVVLAVPENAVELVRTGTEEGAVCLR